MTRSANRLVATAAACVLSCAHGAAAAPKSDAYGPNYQMGAGATIGGRIPPVVQNGAGSAPDTVGVVDRNGVFWPIGWIPQSGGPFSILSGNVVVPAPPGGNIQTLAQNLANRVNITDFDALGCDGNHDISPAFRAFDAALNQSGYKQPVNGLQSAVLYVPPGVCSMGSTANFTHPVEVVGAGPGIGPGGATAAGGTYFVATFASGDIFYVKTPQGQGVSFSDLGFTGPGQRQSGAAIHFTGQSGGASNTYSAIHNVSFLNQYNDVVCDGCAWFLMDKGTTHNSWVNDAVQLNTLPGIEIASEITQTTFFGDVKPNCGTTQEASIKLGGGYARIHDNNLLGSKFHLLLAPGSVRSATVFYRGNDSEEAQVSDVYALYNGLPWKMVSIQHNEFSVIASQCAQSHVTITDAGQVSTVSTKSQNSTLTNVTNPALFYNGMPISGAGIPTGTTITSADGATPVTMSANATATADNVGIKHNGPWLQMLDISGNTSNDYFTLASSYVYNIAGVKNAAIKDNLADNNNNTNAGFLAIGDQVAAPFMVSNNQPVNFQGNLYLLNTANKAVTLIDRTSKLPFGYLGGQIAQAADGSCVLISGATAPTASSFAQAITSGSANAIATMLNGAFVYGNC